MRTAHGHQVEAAPARQFGDPVGRQESCARTHGTRLGARLGAAERLALTWARVAFGGRGLPAGSPVLLLALPLASAFFALRHLAKDERSTRTRLGDGDARQVWSKGLQKSLIPGGKSQRPGCAGASPVACRERRGLDHPERPLRLGVSRGYSCVPGPAAAGSGVASLRWLSRSLTARRGKGAHSPVYARISRQLPPLRCVPLLLPARPGVPTSFGEVLAGSFSIARRLDAGASFAPSPRLAPSLFPHHTPTPRRRHATGRSLSLAITAQPLSSGSWASLGAAEPSGCRELPTGVAGSFADKVAAAAGQNRAVWRGQEGRKATLVLAVPGRLRG